MGESEDPRVEALRFAFDEFNSNSDGKLTRKEFFTFLWELKSTANQRLNEGQMMSCWSAVDADSKGYLTFEEFQSGLEKCYDADFFARQNGVDPSLYHNPNKDGQRALINNEEPETAYNTLKFKKSAGVAAFEALLEEERKLKEQRAKQKEEMGAQAAPAAAGGPMPRSRSRDALVVDKPEKSVVDAPTPTPLPPHVKTAERDKEREQKRLEAQQRMEKALAEKYKAERAARENARRQREEEMKKRQDQEAQAMTQEPQWMRDLKAKRASRNL